MNNLRLRSLSLRNFKRHADLALEFSDTLTVIRGPNWAGKSTVFYAILFALFGASAVPGGAKKIPRRNAGKKDKTEVVLTLHDANESNVVIERTMTTATVHVDGALVASSTTAVNPWVEDTLLQLDQKRALELAYSPQSETASLLTKVGAAELNRRIEELSNADYIEQLIVAANKRVTAAQVRVAARPVQRPLEEINAELSIAGIDVNTLRTDIDAQLTLLEGAVSEAEQIRTSIDALDRNNEIVHKARAAVSTRDELAAECLRCDEEIQKDPGDEARMRAQALVKDASTQLDTINVELMALTTAKKREGELLQWFDTTGNQWDELELNIEPHAEASAELATLLERVGEAKSARTVAQAEIDRLNAAATAAVCSACNRPFDAAGDLDHAIEHERRLAAATATYRDADQAWGAATQAYGLKRSAVDHMAKLLPPAGYKETAQAKLDELTQVQADIDRLAMVATEDRCANAKQRRADAIEAQTATTLATDRAAAAARRRTGLAARLETALADIKAADGLELVPLHELKGDLQKVTDRHKVHRDTVSDLKDQLSKADTRKALLTRERDEVTKVAEALQKDEAIIGRYKGFSTWLRDSKAAFLAETWAVVLSIASEFLRTATMGYATAVERNEDGEFAVVEDGELASIAEVSGGMRAIAATGVRIGMGEILQQGLGFGLLDEPSSELNDDHAAAMSGALRATGRQMILVTHREGDEFSSDKVITL